MERILLVEDNEAIVLGLKYLLAQEGFETRVAVTVREAKEALREKEGFDLALLDVMLPDGDGFELCKYMRERFDIPVIFLTAREEESDVVRGFDLGAVDYVMKPFRNRELISRIRNGLRRKDGQGAEEGKALRCGELILNPESGKVFAGGKEVVLTKLEFRILSAMMTHPGKVFGREEILAAVWDLYGNYVNDNTLSVTMKRIREKIGDTDGKMIKTVRGMGYRLEKNE
ncbi:MAG: response regulator transcription factor [Lachnospiraceae bacterium]|nr:response regulator transcription factor [Lachnospiraceae bacterium]